MGTVCTWTAVKRKEADGMRMNDHGGGGETVEVVGLGMRETEADGADPGGSSSRPAAAGWPFQGTGGGSDRVVWDGPGAGGDPGERWGFPGAGGDLGKC